ncbi:citrulline utilization hydrolase CtlX [Parapedobacter sp. ISTM3]|uniref:citrulline utilization hydrolase CtlX n=1 Tax=Parapedobacter sp. ISTM3 TaxID=2800130 RepID=UPI001F3160C8|nr:arginine deiminase-related protein [Parapedobacter sp. ISTM3]
MTVLMIRPVHFGYNAQTAVNNAFQRPTAESAGRIQRLAVAEFDAFVEQLRGHDVDVLVVQDTAYPHTPDSIFPNNWVSFHEDGTVVLYPMFAENRRLERKQQVLDAISSRFLIRHWVDYTGEETKGKFLEGTGSMVLDRRHRLAYACRSPRTDEVLLQEYCAKMAYRPIVFDANDGNGMPIYHTNVMMCLADGYAVINLESIVEADRATVVNALKETGKTIMPISQAQMDAFAGNMLQIENRAGMRYLVMSSQAYRSLRPEQVEQLTAFNPIIHSPLDTVECHGGGSARCMMAEVFLPLNSNDQRQ